MLGDEALRSSIPGATTSNNLPTSAGGLSIYSFFADARGGSPRAQLLRCASPATQASLHCTALLHQGLISLRDNESWHQACHVVRAQQAASALSWRRPRATAPEALQELATQLLPRSAKAPSSSCVSSSLHPSPAPQGCPGAPPC